MTLTLMEQSAPLPKRPQMGHDVSFIRDKTHTGGHINRVTTPTQRSNVTLRSNVLRFYVNVGSL